jgi:HEAT repeat protein
MRTDGLSSLVGDALKVQMGELAARRPTKNSALQSLIETPSTEVVQLSKQLCTSSNRNEKLLGIRILRELGRPEMPFAEESVAILVPLTEAEQDTELLCWELSALGYQRNAKALPALLLLVNHNEPTVRDEVATALSLSSQTTGLDGRSIDALVRLSRDPDPEVRFSSVFELASWWTQGNKNQRLEAALSRAALDADSRVSVVAAKALNESQER